MNEKRNTGRFISATGRHQAESVTARQKAADKSIPSSRSSADAVSEEQRRAARLRRARELHEQQSPASRADVTSRQAASRPTQGASHAQRKEAAAAPRRVTPKSRIFLVFIAVAAVGIIVVAIMLRGVTDKRDYDSYFQLAQQYYAAADYESALTTLRKADSISETDECSFLMAACYEAMGKYDKALELLRKMDLSDSQVTRRIAELEQRRDELKQASLITVAGRQYSTASTSLAVKNAGLTDAELSSVVQLYALTNLTLSGNRLTDISPLSALGGLTTLDLSDNAISRLDALASLTGLRTLYLDNNPVTDFTPLFSLPSLTTLSIRGIAVTEEQLSALSNALPNCAIHSEEAEKAVLDISLGGATFPSDVETLDLSGMGLTDLSALSVCTSLRTLNLTGNRITDLAPLMDMLQLETLIIKDNQVSDVRPLMALHSLRVINAEGNGISSTVAFSGLSGLEELYLADNPLTDLQGLKGLTGLRTLGLENTGLTDEALEKFPILSSLRTLYIYDNPELSGEAVDELKKELRYCKIEHSELLYSVQIGETTLREDAVEADLSHQFITDISELVKLTQLERLDLSDNSISNIYTFQFCCRALRELDLSNNLIEDITPVSSLTSLQRLDVSGNAIQSHTPFMNLTGLQWLNLRGTSLSQEQVAILRSTLAGCEILSDYDE